MKINFTYPNNNSTQNQACCPKKKMSFGAGLTAKFKQEIMNADVLAISNRLAKKGIPTNFKGNKVIAWGSEKTVEIFQQLNKKYSANLALPKGIFVEDFGNLNVESLRWYGFCNFFPTELKKNSAETVPGKTVFFNSFETFIKSSSPENKWKYDWNNINEIADYYKAGERLGTDHFLGTIFHEFAHVVHEDRLQYKLGGEALYKEFELSKDKTQIEAFRKKYGAKLSGICSNATTDGFEAVAYDIPKLIVNSLDQTTLIPKRNPFIGTPYEKMYFWQQKRIKIPIYTDESRPLDEILRNFWNGKFE